MIAKQIKGKDFYGLLMYHDKKVKSGDAYVLDTNIDLAKVVSMTKEFNIVRQLRPRLQKAVYHVSLNLPATDKLSDNEFSSLAEDYLQGMGFDDNQNLIYMHVDQEHQHIHIIANRVKFSGDVVSDSGDYKRSQKLVRKLEKKYKLTQLAENINREKAALTQKEIEKAIRIGEIPIKLILQKYVKESLEQAENVRQFLDNLKSRKIEAKFNLSKSTERVMGVSFKYNNVVFKGSTLGRKFSWNNIIKQIDYEQSRDRTIILKNDSSKRRDEGADLEARKKANDIFGIPQNDNSESGKIREQVRCEEVGLEITKNNFDIKDAKTDSTLFNEFLSEAKKKQNGTKSNVHKASLSKNLNVLKSSRPSTSFISDDDGISDIDRKKRNKKRPNLF